MVKLTTNFVQETCKDLLMVVKKAYPEQSWDVVFLHRTVSDFLCDDGIRLVIEQQSPDHFRNMDFLVELGKLRSVVLLCKDWERCTQAERIFTDAIDWSQRLGHRDFAWLRRCEALIISIHQQTQKAGMCRRSDHEDTGVYHYVKAGLSEYYSALVVLWPCQALQTYANRATELEIFLWAWLRSMFKASDARMPNMIAACGLRSIASPWGLIPSSSKESTCLKGCSIANLQYPSARMLGDRRVELLDYILSCGVDPNHQGVEQFDWDSSWCSLTGQCRTVWQSWLRAVWLELDHGEAENRRHPTVFGSILNHVKKNISDFVAVFLRHGADPTCSICVSLHLDGGFCKMETLDNILATITSPEGLSHFQTLRTTYLERSDRCVTKYDHMRRAMRSWKTSRRTPDDFSYYDDQDSKRDFLRGFVSNLGAPLCDSLPVECHSSPGFSSAFCLDCTGGYYMCAGHAERTFPDIPTLDDVSLHMIHECLPSDDPHV
jgi:hypothetical protein